FGFLLRADRKRKLGATPGAHRSDSAPDGRRARARARLPAGSGATARSRPAGGVVSPFGTRRFVDARSAVRPPPALRNGRQRLAVRPRLPRSALQTPGPPARAGGERAGRAPPLRTGARRLRTRGAARVHARSATWRSRSRDHRAPARGEP